MKKPRISAEAQSLDTVFGTGVFTAEDDAAIQDFIAQTRNSPENRAAIEAMRQRGQNVVVVESVLVVGDEPRQSKSTRLTS